MMQLKQLHFWFRAFRGWFYCCRFILWHRSRCCSRNR